MSQLFVGWNPQRGHALLLKCPHAKVPGMEVGVSETEPFWTGFLRSLARGGLRGVKLVISDAYEGLKAAISKVFKATWQRCRVHFLRNALAYANKMAKRARAAFDVDQIAFALWVRVLPDATAK
jgi:mutator family transposase